MKKQHVSISSPSSEGGGLGGWPLPSTNEEFEKRMVSISSPSSEGGGVGGSVGSSEGISLFPLVLLQAKVVG